MMQAKVYIHDQVKKVYQLHQQSIENMDADTTIQEQIIRFSNNLMSAWQTKNPACIAQINNWHPDYIGKDATFIFAADFQLSDAQLAIAKDCGFQNMEQVNQHPSITFHLAFEQAVDTLLNGDLDSLKQQIAKNPTLLADRSKYGHQATLLHYAGSNGIEMWRQKTPYNLPDIVQFLLEVGADKTATMSVYGGQFTTWELVSTSAHPKAAGIVEALGKLLR